MSDRSAADRNLLFGVLALQLDFITRDQLIEGMHIWVLERSKPLAEILEAKGFLAKADGDLLVLLVGRHIAQHGGEAEVSLKTLSIVTPVVDWLQQIDDSDVQHSLESLRLRAACGADTISYRNELPSGMRFMALRPHAKGGLGTARI